MQTHIIRGALALSVAVCGGATLTLAQGQPNAAAQVHIEAARRAAGTDNNEQGTRVEPVSVGAD